MAVRNSSSTANIDSSGDDDAVPLSSFAISSVGGRFVALVVSLCSLLTLLLLLLLLLVAPFGPLFCLSISRRAGGGSGRLVAELHSSVFTCCR